ncbi:MAG: SusC/RagA family TonB-linked outer membrane protein [Sediminibacterium sp.]
MNIKKTLVVLLFAIIGISASAQDRTVTGKVTDEKNGAPLVAASVTVKGTNKGTTTAADGTFSINVASNQTTLVVTFLNYATKEVQIAGKNSINVALSQSADQLSEVVVIGYGSVRKKDLTGSVATISSKDFNTGAITTPEQLIAGKVAGVSIISNNGAPGSGSTIRIRGGASLNASNDPLIVIDGMPIDGGGISGQANPLALINPNDIESFSVLKDASAAAIYGARASNGVILITTKKGKKGAMKLDFTSQLSIGNITKKADVLTANEIRSIVNANGTSTLKSLLGNANTDWQDQIYQTAISTDNNISISGAAKNLPYRLSIGNLNQKGILKTDELKRTTVGININPTLFDNHLSINLNYKLSNSESRFANQGAIGAATSFDPTQPVLSSSKRFGGYWEWLDPNATTGLKALSPKNPLGLLMQNNNNSNVTRQIASALFDYKVHFLPDLHVVVNTGMDVAEGKGTTVINDSAASTYNRFKDAANKFHGGVNNQYRQTRSNSYLNAYLNYTKDIKAISSKLELVAGYEYQEYKTTNYNFSDLTFNKTVVNAPNFAFDVPEYRLASYLGRANLNILNKYILTASVRQDGSSKFNPDNRFAVFPSAAIAWKLKEENFLKNSSVFSDLKLRASYGVTGQQDGIGYYDYISYYNLGSNSAQYQFGNNFYSIFRPNGYYFNRKWEQTASANLALEFGLFDNKVSGTIEAYNNTTTDLLNEINQPAGTNFSNKIVANVGSMVNKGVELTLNFQPIKNKTTTWDVSLNATYNKNEITKLTISDDPSYAGARYGGISGGTGNTILIQSVGFQRGSYFVFKQVYDQAGKPIDGLFADLNRDGIVNERDLYQYKGNNPEFFFGASSNLTYKRWNAGFVLRANVGNYMYNNVASSSGTLRNFLNPIGYINNGSRDYLTTGFSGNGSNYYLSDYYVQNASFLRMDNINVGYNIGKLFNNKANLRVNANIQNAFLITKYKGLDPEVNGGIDNNFYPRPRTFVLGLNLNF